MATKRQPQKYAPHPLDPKPVPPPLGGWSTCEQALDVLRRLTWNEFYKLRDHFEKAIPNEPIHPTFDPKAKRWTYGMPIFDPRTKSWGTTMYEIRSEALPDGVGDNPHWPKPINGPRAEVCSRLMEEIQRALLRNKESWIGGTIDELAWRAGNRKVGRPTTDTNVEATVLQLRMVERLSFQRIADHLDDHGLQITPGTKPTAGSVRNLFHRICKRSGRTRPQPAKKRT